MSIVKLLSRSQLKIYWNNTDLMHMEDGEDSEPLMYDSIEVKFVWKLIYIKYSIRTKNGHLKPEVDLKRALAALAITIQT